MLVGFFFIKSIDNLSMSLSMHWCGSTVWVANAVSHLDGNPRGWCIAMFVPRPMSSRHACTAWMESYVVFLFPFFSSDRSMRSSGNKKLKISTIYFRFLLHMCPPAHSINIGSNSIDKFLWLDGTTAPAWLYLSILMRLWCNRSSSTSVWRGDDRQRSAARSARRPGRKVNDADNTYYGIWSNQRMISRTAYFILFRLRRPT